MDIFRETLTKYLNINDDIERARSWIHKQGCSDYRANIFLQEVQHVLDGNDSPFKTADECMDYIDSLRRRYYVGIGL